MSSYVNLLQPSEIKYHSVATDKRFLLKAGIGLVLFFGLYAGWTVWSSIGAARDARAVQDEWEVVKPRYAAAIERNQTLVKLRNTRSYLESWGKTRVPTAHLLLELSALLPDSVQLTQVQLSSQLLGLESWVTRIGRADVTTPERIYKLQLKGLSHGAEGEKTVFQLVEEMKKSVVLSQWLASVKLQDAQKEYLTQEGAAGTAIPDKPSEAPSATAFTIECEFKPRAFAWPGKS